MQHREDVTNFIRRWYRSGVQHQDHHDRFYSLWVCFLVAANDTWPLDKPRNERGDWQLIENYCGDQADKVVTGARGARAASQFLAKRCGTNLRTPIIDTYSDDVAQEQARLASCWREELELPTTEEALFIGHLLCRVRNNVFHGVKFRDDYDDRQLLSNVGV